LAKNSPNQNIVPLKYRAEIDGLRAFAVIPVIFFHAGFELFSGGFTGVDVFFVISGYLITSLLLDDIEKKRFSFIGFYERRARRLLPALYVVVIVTLGVATFLLLPQALLSTAKSALSIPFFSSNFYFWSERGYFGAATEFKPLIHTWSLAVEEQFYLVFPVVLLILARFSKVLFVGFLILVFLVSLAASYYVTRLHADTAFYFPVTRAWELLLGVFCALIIRNNLNTLSTGISEILSALGLVMIAFSYVIFDSDTLFPYVWALVPTLGTALFIVCAGNTTHLKRLLSCKPLVWIGVISYSLYLWHQPVFAFARAGSMFAGYEALLIAGSFLLAYLSYRWIESPFRDRDRMFAKTLWLSVLAGTLVIVIASVLILMSKGLPGRFNAADQQLLVQLATYQSYNRARFNERELEPFDDTSQKKIMLIGDSHAMDFLNLLAESGLFTDYSFSIRDVNTECGNLYLESYDAIQQYIPVGRQERCKVLGRYTGDELDALMREADEIWLISKWLDWVAELLPTSIDNLKADFNKPVRVIGRKDYGEMTQEFALSIPANDRAGYTHFVTEESSQAADRIDAVMKDYEHYYPVMDTMCLGDRNRCRIFTYEGLLISADGSHLTKEGAIEIGQRIQSTLKELRE